MNKTLGIFAVLLVLSLPTFVQPPSLQESLLDHMVGRWLLHGAIAGKQTTHDVDARWVLNHGYVRLHEVSREKNASGGPEYEAIVFISFDPKRSEYSCLWLDTTGNGGLSADLIGRGKAEGNKIQFLFKPSSGDIFHTTLLYNPSADAWQWIMDEEEGGKLQPFARLKLTRK